MDATDLPPWDPAMGFRERAFALYITYVLDGCSLERARAWQYCNRRDLISRAGVELPVWSEGQQSCRMLATLMTGMERPTTSADVARLAGS